MQVSNLSTLSGEQGYRVLARFTNIGGLKVRSPVTMAGVTIGRVSNIAFDNSTYEAVVTMKIDRSHDTIPEDTFANIFTAGLLGEQYIGLDPGGSTSYLRDGSEITHTQSALILEQIIGQFLFNKAAEASIETTK